MSRRIGALVAVLGLLVAGSVGSAAPAAAAPGPPAYPEYWFDQWGVTQLWAQGARGQGVTIAEIDTGVNGSLPELSANLEPGKDFSSLGGDGEVDRDTSAFGHGTAMASIMVAHPGSFGVTGLAPDAKLLPLAVPIMGTTAAAGNDHLPDAIRYAADHGARIISMSLGGDRSQARDALACPTDEQDAITYAIGKGAIVVASAGNGGQKGSPPEDPGVCIGVVSVGAVDQSGSVADFSSRERYLTLSAPGVAVASLGRVAGTAYSGSGTSQAAALTSAALALVWSAHPALSSRDILTRVLYTLDAKTATRTPEYGYGRLDLPDAVNADVPAGAPNPVFDAITPFLRILGSPQPGIPVASPASTLPAAPGAFTVGRAPSALSARTVAGIGIAAAGLLLIVLAGLVAMRGRARRRARHGPPTDPPPADPIPAERVIDALAWQVIPAAEPPAPPAP